MAFAMCPDDGLPRLYRKVEALPEGLICRLDRKQNILEINPDKFEALSKTEKHIVLRTQRHFIAEGEVLDVPTFRFSQAAE
jgi:hypothetical protein